MHKFNGITLGKNSAKCTTNKYYYFYSLLRRFVHNIVQDSVVQRSQFRKNQRNQMISPIQLNHRFRSQRARAQTTITIHTREEDRDQHISPQHHIQQSLQSYPPLQIETTIQSLTKFFNAESLGAHHRHRLLVPRR